MKSQFKENENLDNKPRYKYARASYRADNNRKRTTQNEKNIKCYAKLRATARIVSKAT